MYRVQTWHEIGLGVLFRGVCRAPKNMHAPFDAFRIVKASRRKVLCILLRLNMHLAPLMCCLHPFLPQKSLWIQITTLNLQAQRS